MTICHSPAAGAEAKWPTLAQGQTQHHALPGGTFSFIVGEEPMLGRFQMCSLFSPMERFVDQEAALATAEAAMAELLTPQTTEASAPQALSRRRLFGLAPDQGEAVP